MRIISCFKRRVHYVLKNPYAVFVYFNFSKIQRVLPDKSFMKLMVRARLGYKLNLENPRTFNEKMQWLKLYDRKSIYTQMVDKYEAKFLISKIIGEKYVVPNFGVWDSFEEIDFDSLPDQFVLKTTHDCGGVIICKEKEKFDYERAKTDFTKRLKNNFFWQGREWPYKNVKPRILAEKYLSASNDSEDHFIYDPGMETGITDYKIMCFNGKPFCCLVCMGRNSREGLHENFYDTEWNLLPFKRDNPQYKGEIEKPKDYEQMLHFAQKLSEGTKFLRVDFFENNGRLYVGELTFFPASGFDKFIPEEWDLKLGEMIELDDYHRAC